MIMKIAWGTNNSQRLLQVREYADIVERLDRDYTQLRSSVINAKDLDKLKRDLYKVHVCFPNANPRQSV